MGSLIAKLFHLVLAFLELQFQVVQLAQNRIQTLVLCRKMLLCRFNDALWDAELLADEEGVGFAGNADAQLVCGAQRLKVKFTAGIDDAFRLQSEDLQLCIVGGRHQQHTTAAQLLDDGDCQRSTLGGVCACSQLVQQDQCAGHGQFQDACDLLHVAGEGGQALFDALLVADVHEELVKYADLAALVGRNKEAALCHGTQQTGRFQGDCLAAGVRAGDDKRIVVSAQRDIHRDALFGVDERMPCPDE